MDRRRPTSLQDDAYAELKNIQQRDSGYWDGIYQDLRDEEGDE